MATSKTELLNALSRHQGRENGIGAKRLAEQLQISPRELRKLISRVRDEDGHAVCGHPSTGYFMAVTPEELQQSCAFLEHRALHSLRVLSRMKKVSLADLLGQMKLNQA
jgi:biotin operon repressor